jgi:DNA-binding HxlR family transcriptional regulator
MNSSSKSNPPTNILDFHPYLRQTLDLVADKWVVAVLQREIGDISQRMLTRTLRDLERNGLVQRKVYPVVPPMVEYSLTTLGETINGVLKSVCEWSTENFDAVEAARVEYDQSQGRQ